MGSTIKHGFVSSLSILQASHNGITFRMAGPDQPHTGYFWLSPGELMGQGSWPSVTAFGHEAKEIRIQQVRVPAINSVWEQYSYPLPDQCHSQRDVAFGLGSQLPSPLSQSSTSNSQLHHLLCVLNPLMPMISSQTRRREWTSHHRAALPGTSLHLFSASSQPRALS